MYVSRLAYPTAAVGAAWRHVRHLWTANPPRTDHSAVHGTTSYVRRPTLTRQTPYIFLYLEAKSPEYLLLQGGNEIMKLEILYILLRRRHYFVYLSTLGDTKNFKVPAPPPLPLPGDKNVGEGRNTRPALPVRTALCPGWSAPCSGMYTYAQPAILPAYPSSRPTHLFGLPILPLIVFASIND